MCGNLMDCYSSISPMVSMKWEQKSIHSLLTILLDNAVKYSDEDGTILVTLEKKMYVLTAAAVA